MLVSERPRVLSHLRIAGEGRDHDSTEVVDWCGPGQDGRADGDIAGILSGRSSVEETAKVVNFDDSGFRPRFFVFDHTIEEIILGRRFVDLRVGCARPVQPGR